MLDLIKSVVVCAQANFLAGEACFQQGSYPQAKEHFLTAKKILQGMDDKDEEMRAIEDKIKSKFNEVQLSNSC